MLAVLRRLVHFRRPDRASGSQVVPRSAVYEQFRQPSAGRLALFSQLAAIQDDRYGPAAAIDAILRYVGVHPSRHHLVPICRYRHGLGVEYFHIPRAELAHRTRQWGDERQAQRRAHEAPGLGVADALQGGRPHPAPLLARIFILRFCRPPREDVFDRHHWPARRASAILHLEFCEGCLHRCFSSPAGEGVCGQGRPQWMSGAFLPDERAGLQRVVGGEGL
mmetsp:Transcript_13080/g.46519  ORF Transcript_13080/g.46519 Transcript_13080/m.46519 type:complete len:221 (+) Transcript_13080:1229-1891(+)